MTTYSPGLARRRGGIGALETDPTIPWTAIADPRPPTGGPRRTFKEFVDSAAAAPAARASPKMAPAWSGPRRHYPPAPPGPVG